MPQQLDILLTRIDACAVDSHCNRVENDAPSHSANFY